MPPGIRKNSRHHGTNFNQYSVVRGHDRLLPHLHNQASPHTPLVPSTLARARRAYPSQARLGYAGADRSAPHLHNHVPVRIPPIASKDSLDEASSPSVVQSLRTGSLPLASAPCLNRVQTSNKAHDKFVPLRDCACADHSRPSLSAALLSGWSSHLTFPSSSSTTIIVRKSRRCLNCRNP